MIHTYAYFVTPHGYGHAARSAAVMNAIYARQPGTHFEIFTRTPVWFFKMSLEGSYTYHDYPVDLGLVQTSAMDADLGATLRLLEGMLPFRKTVVDDLARQVQGLGCTLALCDIAPLGIAVARKAGLPSVLMENFTWDWIYAEYLEEEPRFSAYIDYLREQFARADRHIRTQPAWPHEPPAHLTSEVVSRKPRASRAETRRRLGVGEDEPMTLITMGGILTHFPFLDRLAHSKEIKFLIPGGSDHYEQRGSLVLIPHHSDYYHPNLVAASDAVIGKLGYSTLAEAYAAGLPFAYIPRDHFRESPPMARFARQHMETIELEEERFFSGEWLDLLPELLAKPKRVRSTPNGADQIAAFVTSPAIHQI